MYIYMQRAHKCPHVHTNRHIQTHPTHNYTHIPAHIYTHGHKYTHKCIHTSTHTKVTVKPIDSQICNIFTHVPRTHTKIYTQAFSYNSGIHRQYKHRQVGTPAGENII